MEIRIDKIESQNLKREMNIEVYGHYGVSVLVFPALSDSSSEMKDAGAVDAVEHIIKIGKCKIFCVEGVNTDLWKNPNLSPKEKSELLFNYNKFIEEECVPYIYSQCGGAVPIITAGAAYGAFHAANSFLRRPDIFLGTIALSGSYEIASVMGTYFDDNCYFNSPLQYLPNLNDSYWLSFLYSRRHIYLASGSGTNEKPENTLSLAAILQDKGIRHIVEIWGPEYNHEHKTWIEMFKSFIEKRL